MKDERFIFMLLHFYHTFLQKSNVFYFTQKLSFKFTTIWKLLTIIVLNLLLYVVNAASTPSLSTSTNAVYNGAWSGVSSGTPSSNQSNTFNATGSSAALTIAGGVAASLDYSTNNIYGSLVLNGDGSGNATGYFDNSTNTITGGITIGEGCSGNFSRSVNTISGGVTINGGSGDFSAFGSGNSTNTITGGVTIGDNGNAIFSNSGNRSVRNTITGGITLGGANGTADFSNSGVGSTINTIDTINLSNSSTLTLGGTRSTTTLDTLNWSGGTLQFAYANGGFGNTTIDTLNITAPVQLKLYDANFGEDLAYAPSSTKTFFTVTGKITGDPSNIQLVNTSPFHEVIANGTTNGITVAPDGTVTISTVPTATTGQSNALEALSAANDLLPGLQTSVANLESAFASTAYQQAKVRADMVRIMHENPGDSGEALITALAQERSGTVVKVRGDWRIFAAPFTAEIRNKGLGGYMAGFKEKFYGLLMGGSHYFKKSGVTLLGMIGLGASKTQQDRSVNSFANGKNVMLGLNARKTFIDLWKINWDAESNLSGIAVKSVQQREGNPTPTQRYIAHSRYNTYALALRSEVGPIFKLPHGFSIKPDVGLQLNGSKRTKINEENAGIYAQNYKASISRNGEIYGGAGVRKQWKGEIYEGKVTLKYEVGQKSGNGKSSNTIYTETLPEGFSSSSKTPGRFTHYINIYGSLLNMKSNWKFVPGITITLQKGQRSIAGTMKFEHRF